MNFNLDRIKDKKVREAITYAIADPSRSSQADGGAYGGELAGGLISPDPAGLRATYDPFGKLKKPHGDPRRPRSC